ncbi:orotate phosphoribosyltransferase [Diplocloster hominis]|uniref:orotate phosphoribosyltransferase n=1 Tax=Diplocloster hominis TaxID=3079010 RepID=UPI0031BA854B
MQERIKIPSKENPELHLTVTPGHFSSDRFHVNYYIDMSNLKMRQKESEMVAKTMSQRYVSRVNLTQTNMGGSDCAFFSEMARSFASKTPIDTIICMDGCEVIGAYVAQELSKLGVSSQNEHKSFYVVSPEFDSSGQMVVRDNIRRMIRNKHVLVVLATAMSGRTIYKSIRCITSYGGIVEGISVIFSVIDNIEGYPVNSVFNVSDLPDFKLSEPDECEMCKAGLPMDAIVNSYGYSEL